MNTKSDRRWCRINISPLGSLRVVETESGTVLSVEFESESSSENPGEELCSAAQLTEYFRGERRVFELNLDPEGTEFEQRVWSEVREIPYGETATYGEIARRLGDREASRAVGLANARNPIAIFVPCHRVVGADGSLTGYAGGLDRKKWLLDMESGQQCLGF